MENMENQQLLENIESDFLTLSFADQTLHTNSSQLSNDCMNMILDTDNCQNISAMTPLNDLLLGQSFTIETNEPPLFVDDAQSITFQNIDSNSQLNNIQTISTAVSEKPMVQDINFTINFIDHFQDLYPDFIKPNTNTMKTTNHRNNLKENVDNLHNTDIDTTKENYSNSTALKILSDIAKIPTDTNGHFVCDLCLSEFHNWLSYKKHKLEHLNDKPFKCLKCLKSFNYNNNYLLHIASHLTNNLKCPQCKKEFNRKASFKSHLKIHKTEELITCNICFEIFDNQYRLDIHKEQCNQTRIHSENSVEVTSAVFQICKICKKSFSTISDYKTHIKEHRKFDSVLKKQHKLSIKFKNISKTKNLEKKFKCIHCDWSFNKSNLLSRHMRTHTGEKPFECSHCSKLFTQRNSLKRHLLKHKGLRPYICDFCDMRFSQKGHLIRHIKRCHAVTKETTRIHSCSMCTCVYNSLNALNKHLNKYHGFKTKKSNKNVQNLEPKSIETNDFNETINLITESSKLEKWLEEVALELQNDDNNTELKHCNNSVPTQCEFELNLIGNEHQENSNKDCSSYSIIKTNNQIEVENSTNSLKNGENYNVSKKKQELTSIICTKNQVKNKEKEERNINRNISVSSNVKETITKSSSRNKEGVSRLDIKTSLPKKTNAQTLNLKNSSICHQTSNNTDHTLNNAEPIVLYVPNITSNIEDVNINEEKEERNINRNISVSSNVKETITKSSLRNKGGVSRSDIKTSLPKKTNAQTLNLKNCSICHKTSNNTNHKFTNAEPIVLYVPNITKNIEGVYINGVPVVQPKVCPFCGKIFKKNCDLERHERTHTGDKPYKCDKQGCDKAFATKNSLKYHTVTHLGKMKRAICPQCDGLFATASTLKVHMRQHTGEKPFKCPVCGDAFRTSGHLRTHVITHDRKKKQN